MLTYVRSLQTLAAGAWLGGMVLIAIVAATTFGEMRKTDVAGPNAIAGRVMAKNFQRFDIVQGTCAVIIILSQGVILSSNRKPREWFHAVLIVAAAGLFLYSVFSITPKILEMQNAVGKPDPDAAVKAIFDSIHATSVRIAQINLLVIAVLTLSLGAARVSSRAAGPSAPTASPKEETAA